MSDNTTPTDPESAERIADLIRALIEAHPREALQLLFGVEFKGGEVILDVTPPKEPDPVWGEYDFALRNHQIGRTEGRFDAVRTLLQERFGDTPGLDDLARQLSGHNYGENIGRIVAGATLEELRA